MAKLNLNQPPFYDSGVDEFNKKNYKKVLFNPQVAVQNRELTAIGTYANENLKELAESIHNNGKIISGCNVKSIDKVNGTITMNTGKIYIDGYIHTIDPLLNPDITLTLPITIVGEEFVYVEVVEELVGATGISGDDTLKDPAIGTDNYGFEGASRLKVWARYVTKSSPLYDATKEYFTIVELKDGEEKKTLKPSDVDNQSTIETPGDIASKKMFNVLGDYVISGFKSRHSPLDDILNRLCVEVDPGTAFINGNFISHEQKTYFYPQVLRFDYAVYDEIHVIDKKGELNNYEYSVDQSPLTDVIRISAPVIETKNDLNADSGLAGNSYNLPSGYTMKSVEKVYQGGTTFYRGSDYDVGITNTGFTITWLGGGNKPVGNYSVDYVYNRIFDPTDYEIDYFGKNFVNNLFNVTNGVVTLPSDQYNIFIKKITLTDGTLLEKGTDYYQINNKIYFNCTDRNVMLREYTKRDNDNSDILTFPTTFKIEKLSKNELLRKREFVNKKDNPTVYDYEIQNNNEVIWNLLSEDNDLFKYTTTFSTIDNKYIDVVKIEYIYETLSEAQVPETTYKSKIRLKKKIFGGNNNSFVVNTSYKYGKTRYDNIILTKEGKISYVYGTMENVGNNFLVPIKQTNALVLNEVMFKPLTTASIHKFLVRYGLKMNDILDVRDRVKTLEYNISMTDLEKTADKKYSKSSLKGIVTDNFDTIKRHDISKSMEIAQNQLNVAIPDVIKEKLYPNYTKVNIDLEVDNTKTTAGLFDNNYYLQDKITPKKWIDQPNATKWRSTSEGSSASSFNEPKIKISPDSDYFNESTYKMTEENKYIYSVLAVKNNYALKSHSFNIPENFTLQFWIKHLDNKPSNFISFLDSTNSEIFNLNLETIEIPEELNNLLPENTGTPSTTPLPKHRIKLGTLGANGKVFDGSDTEIDTTGIEVEEGNNFSVVIKADDGFVIDDYTIKSTPPSPLPPGYNRPPVNLYQHGLENEVLFIYNIENIHENYEISAKFKTASSAPSTPAKPTRKVIVNNKGNGDVRYQGKVLNSQTESTIEIENGGKVYLEMLANNNYALASISDNGNITNYDVEKKLFELNNIIEDHIILVMFKEKPTPPPQTSNLTVNIVGNGKVYFITSKINTVVKNELANGSITPFGKNGWIPFKATASSGWKIKSIEYYTTNLSTVDGKSEYDFTIKDLDSDCTLKVTFEQLPQPKPTFQVIGTIDGSDYGCVKLWEGSFSGREPIRTSWCQLFNQGTKVIYKIKPDTNCVIKRVLLNGSDVGISNLDTSYYVTIDNISRDTRLYAEFGPSGPKYTYKVVSLGSYIGQNWNVQGVDVYVKGDLYHLNNPNIVNSAGMTAWLPLRNNLSYYYSNKEPLSIYLKAKSGYRLKKFETGSYPDCHDIFHNQVNCALAYTTTIPISKLNTRVYGNGCVVFVEAESMTPPPPAKRRLRVTSSHNFTYSLSSGGKGLNPNTNTIVEVDKVASDMIVYFYTPKEYTTKYIIVNGIKYNNCKSYTSNRNSQILYTNAAGWEHFTVKIPQNQLKDYNEIVIGTERWVSQPSGGSGRIDLPAWGSIVRRLSSFDGFIKNKNDFSLTSTNNNSGFDCGNGFDDDFDCYELAEVVKKITKFGSTLSFGNSKEFLFEPSLNKWYNYTFTFDKTNKTVNFYVDGDLVRKDIKIPDNIWTKISTIKHVTVGNKKNSTITSGNFYFTELKIYDKLLNPTEIKNGCNNKANTGDANLFKLYSLSTDHNGMDLYIGDASDWVADHTFFSFGIKEKRPYSLVLNNAIDHSLGNKPAPIVEKNSTNIGSYKTVDQKTDVTQSSQQLAQYSTQVTTTTTTTTNTYNNNIIQDKTTTTNFEEKVVGESAQQMDFITSIEPMLTLKERNIIVYGYDFFPNQNGLVCYFNNVKVPFISTTKTLPDVNASVAGDTKVNPEDGSLIVTNTGEFLAEIKIPPNQPIGVREIRVDFPGNGEDNAGVKVNYFGAGIKSNKIASTIKTPIKAWVSQRSEIVQRRTETTLVKSDVKETVNTSCSHCNRCNRCSHCSHCAANCSRCGRCSHCNFTTPLAQSLYVNDLNRFFDILTDVKEKSDVFVVASDLFFKSVVNDTTILNGFIKLTDSGMPVTLKDDSFDRSVASFINIPTNNVNMSTGNPHQASAATKVSYVSSNHYRASIGAHYYSPTEPIKLHGGEGYGYIVGSENGNNMVWVAEIGKIDILTNKVITQEPDRGILMSSPNSGSWATYILEDLKYTVYIADFWENSSNLVDIIENSRNAKVSYVEFKPITASDQGLEFINFFEFVAHSDVGTDGNSQVRYEYKDKVDGEWADNWKVASPSFIVNLEHGAEALMFRACLISYSKYSSPIVSKNFGIMVGQYELPSYYTSYNTKTDSFNTVDIYFGDDNSGKLNTGMLEYSTNGGVTWTNIIDSNVEFLGKEEVNKDTNLSLLHFTGKLYLKKPVLLAVEGIDDPQGVFKHELNKKYYFAVATLDDDLRETEISEPVEFISTTDFNAKFTVIFDTASFGYRIYACQVGAGDEKKFVRIYDSTLLGRLKNTIGLGNDRIYLKDNEYDAFKNIYPQDKDITLRLGEENILAELKADHILPKTRGHNHTPKTSHSPDEIVYFGNDAGAMNLSPVVNVNFPYRFPLEKNQYSETFKVTLDTNNVKSDILQNNSMTPEYNEYNKPRYVGNNIQFRVVFSSSTGATHIKEIKDVPTFSKVMLVTTRDVM